MRSLEDWHRYVDLNVKRAAQSRRPQPADDREAPHLEEGAEPARDDWQGTVAAPTEWAQDGGRAEREPGGPDQSLAPVGQALAQAPQDAPERSLRLDGPFAALFEVGDLTSSEAPPVIHLQRPAPVYTQPLSHPAEEPANCGNGHGEEARALLPRRAARSAKAAGPLSRRESREELLARLLDPDLTLDEAAQLLGVCPTTVRRYTNRGILPHYRTVGNQRRFRLSQILAFLESQAGSAIRADGAGEAPGNEET